MANSSPARMYQEASSVNKSAGPVSVLHEDFVHRLAGHAVNVERANGAAALDERNDLVLVAAALLDRARPSCDRYRSRQPRPRVRARQWDRPSRTGRSTS